MNINIKNKAILLIEVSKFSTIYLVNTANVTELKIVFYLNFFLICLYFIY